MGGRKRRLVAKFCSLGAMGARASFLPRSSWQDRRWAGFKKAVGSLLIGVP